MSYPYTPVTTTPNLNDLPPEVTSKIFHHIPRNYTLGAVVNRDMRNIMFDRLYLSLDHEAKVKMVNQLAARDPMTSLNICTDGLRGALDPRIEKRVNSLISGLALCPDASVRLKCLKMILDDNRFDPTYEENKALVTFASAGMVEEFFAIYRNRQVELTIGTSFSEALYQCCSNSVSSPSKQSYMAIAAALLADKRVDPSYNNNSIVYMLTVMNQYEMVKLILASPLVDPASSPLNSYLFAFAKTKAEMTSDDHLKGEEKETMLNILAAIKSKMAADRKTLNNRDITLYLVHHGQDLFPSYDYVFAQVDADELWKEVVKDLSDT